MLVYHIECLNCGHIITGLGRSNLFFWLNGARSCPKCHHRGEFKIGLPKCPDCGSRLRPKFKAHQAGSRWYKVYECANPSCRVIDIRWRIKGGMTVRRAAAI